jgi:hypothetical protein
MIISTTVSAGIGCGSRVAGITASLVFFGKGALLMRSLGFHRSSL